MFRYPCILLFLTLGIASAGIPVFAQTGETPKERLVAIVKDADYVLRRFEEVSSRVQFARWKAPYAMVETEQELLGKSRELARRLRIHLEQFASSQINSGVDMFKTYDSLRSVCAYSQILAYKLRQYAPQDKLSGDLFELVLPCTEIQLLLLPIVLRQLEANDLELVVCRLNRQSP